MHSPDAIPGPAHTTLVPLASLVPNPDTLGPRLGVAFTRRSDDVDMLDEALCSDGSLRFALQRHQHAAAPGTELLLVLPADGDDSTLDYGVVLRSFLSRHGLGHAEVRQWFDGEVWHLALPDAPH